MGNKMESSYYLRSTRKGIPVVPDAPLPLEYRYGTGIAGLLTGGSALLLLAGFFLEGGVRLLVVFPAALGIGLGFLGLMVDPRGCIGSVGRRLVVTDAILEEVDEKGRIRWCFSPGDVLAVKVERRRAFIPWRRTTGRHAEVWYVQLRNRPAVRIPIWLLPDLGGGFKQRFNGFLKRAGVRHYWLGDAA